MSCAQNGVITPAQTTQDTSVELRKSPNDPRAYRYLELPNDLRVVLVSDPSTEKSAAALAVFRGSQHEPSNRAGLAHFLEHMLFIQTETYPEIDGFFNFIRANGGSSNAYTALDHTNYFFDVRNDGFIEGLDRFAHFFIDPILSPEYSAREKNAVDSEYQMQLKDDGWRGFMVSKQTLNPTHPHANFTIGSLETLDGDIHQDLKAFFQTQYSADQMALVAIGRESLDELERRIAPLFGQIKNHKIGPAHPVVPLYSPGALPALLEHKTQKDGAQISFQFPLPSTRSGYKNKAEQYLSNLLGHEGAGSLYQLLSRYGWIESLSAGVSTLDHNTSGLTVGMQLTPKGRQHTEEITDLLFRYIELLKSSPPQAWLYEEQARVAQLGFQFQDTVRPTSLVYQLAPRINDYPPEDLLVAPYLMEAFDASTIIELLTHLRPDNVLVQLAAADVEGASVEPWFKVPFNLITGPIKRRSIMDLEQALAQLSLPSVNPYLPEDLTLVEDDTAPIKRMFDIPELELWVDIDTSFGTPRANLFIEIAVRGGLVSPEDRALGQLYRLLVQDALSEVTYPAYLAGLGYSLSVPDSGFQVQIGGYQDKQLTLLNTVLNSLRHEPFDRERFAKIKASLIKTWRNSTKERPYVQAMAALTDVLNEARWPRPLMIDALEPLTLEQLMDWREKQFAHVAVRGLIHGSVAPSRIADLRDVLTAELLLSPVAFTQPVAERVDDAQLLALDVDHQDAAMVLHVPDPDDTPASRAMSALAAQILHQAYFQELRTEQQLGYVVSVSNRPIAKRGGISFIVQSPNTSAADLEIATLEFMEAFIADWQNQPETKFETQKAGLISRLVEQPKSLNERSQRYWTDLRDAEYQFDSRQQIAAWVDTIEPGHMLDYFQRLQRHLHAQRLLIFSKGRFEDIPLRGRLLSGNATERPSGL